MFRGLQQTNLDEPCRRAGAAPDMTRAEPSSLQDRGLGSSSRVCGVQSANNNKNQNNKTSTNNNGNNDGNNKTKKTQQQQH